jgi:hypothetical protein
MKSSSVFKLTLRLQRSAMSSRTKDTLLKRQQNKPNGYRELYHKSTQSDQTWTGTLTISISTLAISYATIITSAIKKYLDVDCANILIKQRDLKITVIMNAINLLIDLYNNRINQQTF